MTVAIEQPPSEFTLRQREYLTRMLRQLADEIERDPVLHKSTRLPDGRVSAGTLRYFSEAIPPTITAPGVYFFDGLAWNKL